MENITLNGTRPFVFQSEIPLRSAFYVTVLKNTKHCLVNPSQGILTENKKIIHVICSSKWKRLVSFKGSFGTILSTGTFFTKLLRNFIFWTFWRKKQRLDSGGLDVIKRILSFFVCFLFSKDSRLYVSENTKEFALSSPDVAI